MAWPDNLFRWLGFGRYNSSLPTVAEGQVEELQVDSRGRLRVAIESSGAALQARYQASPTPVADGELTDVLVDTLGRLQLVLADPAEPATRYLSAAAERSASAKITAGTVREVQVISTSSADRYLMLIDKSGAVAGADAPFYRAFVPAGSQVSVTFGPPRSFGAGLQVALSSTAATWTDPGADEALFYVEMD